MNKTELADFATAHAGELVNVRYTDGTEMTVVLTGKVTTKGPSFKISAEEAVAGYLPATKVEAVTLVGANKDEYTTAEVAAMLNMEAKVLRVHLRAMGVGVGRGSRYTLTPADVATIKAHLNA